MRLGIPADGFIKMIISPRYYSMGFIFFNLLTFKNLKL
jgi:hypothetical protein